MELLIAVDDSLASERAVDYVADCFAHGEERHRVRLVHVLPPVPPCLSESAERGRGEEIGVRTESRKSIEETWLAEQEQSAHPLLDRLRRRLMEDGFEEGRLAMDFIAPMPGESVARAVLESAEQHGSETIVVGRTALPWYREVFRHHVSSELVRQAEGHTVWVVE
jgi:nucleotide-binding universal stress UspA family protein